MRGTRASNALRAGVLMAGLAAATLATLTGWQARADELPMFACAQGNAQLCYAQGQSRCRKSNARADAPSACEIWTEACLECQAAISNCFERWSEPILEGSAECTGCHVELTACMAAVDKEYWPNREQTEDR